MALEPEDMLIKYTEGLKTAWETDITNQWHLRNDLNFETQHSFKLFQPKGNSKNFTLLVFHSINILSDLQIYTNPVLEGLWCHRNTSTCRTLSKPNTGAGSGSPAFQTETFFKKTCAGGRDDHSLLLSLANVECCPRLEYRILSYFSLVAKVMKLTEAGRET